MSINLRELNTYILYSTGKNLLLQEARLKGGRFSWLNTTLLRWARFSSFCKKRGVTNLTGISEDLVTDYSTGLENLSVPTQQNYISAINVVMSLYTKGVWPVLSPSKITNTRRNNIRKKKGSIEPSIINHACSIIRNSYDIRYEFSVRLAYEFGLRRKEALLIEFHVAKKQAKKTGMIDICRGTKGGRGRNVERLVPVSESGMELLNSICKTYPEHRCLLLDDSYKRVSAALSSKILPILSKSGIAKFHDLRVAYACRRYFDLLGVAPPCDGTFENIEIEKDTDARKVISLELGHSRINITNSYLGSSYEK